MTSASDRGLSEVLADVLIRWALREENDINRADRIGHAIKRLDIRSRRRFDNHLATSGKPSDDSEVVRTRELWAQACELDDRLRDEHRRIAQTWPARFDWESGRRLPSD